MRFGMISVCDNDPARRSTQQYYAELLDQIVLAEELGYDDFWIAEHHYSNYGVVPSPATLLAAAAARTSRIKLGSGVSILPFHDPMRIAEEYAMVDVIRNGRLVFGMGRGFLRHEYEAFGIRDDAHSRELFDEALEVILKAWAGEPFSYQGKHFQVDDVTLNVLPVQRPHPPLYMAAQSPSSYEKAARADIPVAGVIATVKTLDRVAERIATFKKLYAEAGHDATAVEIPMAWYAFALEDRSRVYEDGGRHLIDYYRSIGSVFDLEAVTDPAVRKVYEELQHWNQTVTWEHIEAQTDVAMIGDPAQLIDRIRRAEDAGADKIQLQMSFGNRPHDEVAASMRLFAREVMPAFA